MTGHEDPPARSADTMSDAIALSSPGGRMPLDAEYRRHYNWGWRYSLGEAATLDYVDTKYAYGRKPGHDAAMDGYLDAAASRDKWHMPQCRAGHLACEEHRW